MTKRVTQDIDVDKLDQLVKDLGVRIRLYKSTLCPNMKSLESMDHDINCSVCNNSMIDFCPVETIALFQQQDLMQQFKALGTFHMDEVLMTFLAGQTLQHYARIELIDFEEDFFELIQRQVGGNTDYLKYPACSVVGLFVIRSNVKVQFHYETDFEVDINGNLKWVSANKPLDKEIYTIYYKYHPTFRVIKAVHRDRYSQFNTRINEIQAPKTIVGDTAYVKLGEAWIAKKDYLLERRDMDQNLLPDNVAYDPNA